MAHPTIDLTQQPNPDCLHPAYNCVKYCFEANDFQTQVGTKAGFTIKKNALADGHAPGLLFVIAGQDFKTSTINSYSTINTAPVQTTFEYATNFKAALEANSYIYNNFHIEIIADEVVATARAVGVQDDFIFDYSSATNPPGNTDTNGLNDEYLENYRLIVEIWQRIKDTPTTFIDKKITAEAYTPNADGTFCINIGEKVAPLLESFFPFDSGGSIAFIDQGISGNFYIRYGESYSDTINSCDVQLRTFESSVLIGVINSAFQRQDQVAKTALMCEHQWMTNAPQYTQVCPESNFLLWINLNNILAPFPTTIKVRGKYIITYTDGTTSTHTTGAYLHSVTSANQVAAVQAGVNIIPFFADPSKVVDFYEVRIQQEDPPTVQDFGSQFFKMVSCCDGDVEFYFLNEYGGYDTILFTQVDAIELAQSNAVFQQFTDCEEEDTLRTGKKIVDQTANDFYTVTSKFTDNYITRKWIREFLSSPIKSVKMKVEADEDTILSKVIVDPGAVQYFTGENNSLFLRIQFTLNESINLQKN